MTIVSSSGRVAVLALSILAAGAAEAAVTWHGLQFGGFASQGYLYSSANDYLGETSEGTFDFREYGVNGSWSKSAWRVGAQVFGQKLGEFGDDEIKLDWATVDFQPHQAFGVRAGRVKMPRGLYNEALDLDAVRPFVLLPQSVYDARLRDFNASFDGGMVYGNVSLHRAGSLDYRLFLGEKSIDTDSGANAYFNNDLPFPSVSMEMDSVHGGSLFWNTPVSGLRVGYSYSAFKDLTSLRDVPMMGRLTRLARTTPKHERHLLSAELTQGDWVFAVEAAREVADYAVVLPNGMVYSKVDFESTYGYVSASRRINAWLELGGYYSYSKDEQVMKPALTVIPVLEQHDFALSARFDVNEHLIFKLEGHLMDGAGKIFDTPAQPQPFARRDESWTLFAAKATILF